MGTPLFSFNVEQPSTLHLFFSDTDFLGGRGLVCFLLVFYFFQVNSDKLTLNHMWDTGLQMVRSTLRVCSMVGERQ